MNKALATKITGTGSSFPKKILTNAELVAQLAKNNIETNEEWIKERTGILERRIADPKNPDEHNSSLGAQAALKALDMAGRSAEDVEFILYSTCTPDTLVPSTACWLQHKIKAKNAWALDLNAACSGFVYALSLANDLIQSGRYQKGLVVAGDVLSAFTNWDDRSSCILFGDGAGAFFVERANESDSSRILSSHLGADGSLWELFHMPAGGSRIEVTPDVIEKKLHKMMMEGREIFKSAVKILAEYAEKALESNQMSMNDLDWYIPHQANMRIIQSVAKRFHFPMEKIIINIDRFGNTSAATVPTAFDEAVRQGKIKKGQTVLLDVFGAGLTYGSLLLKY